MYSPNPNASISPSARSGRRAYPVEDVVYQVVTVGAILLVLGSLWVF
ncbi:MAG TPA: hypothetical protein VG267_07590 [Terracidiphilus sp.]|jgi:hypothetical protein|nr:hypothetical protein [Terracidiphilus sp.]